MGNFYKFTKIVVLLSLIISYFTNISIVKSAYLTYVPITIKQPTGETFNVFASGDEFYNWIHDSTGYTIIQNPTTGFYTYAVKSGDTLLPSNNIVGKVDPSTIGIQKWLKYSYKIIQKRMFEFNKTRFAAPPGTLKNKNNKILMNTGTINNIIIFIRFSDESEFTDNLSTYSDLFNATTGSSLLTYYKEASYNSLTISSTFYPTTAGQTVVSYQDSHPRAYYEPYSTSNTIGYTGGDGGNDRMNREHTLLVNAVNAVNSQIPPGLNIDNDNNGYVDNVCFIVSGTPTGWASLLWPHMWSLYSQTITINGKRVWTYNFQIRSMTISDGVGVLCHEMFHSLGAPDLYHYSYDGLSPVYYWDLMENTTNPPQHMGAYMKYRYGGWINSIPEITLPGTYTLNSLDNQNQNCYKIKSPNSTTEYFVLEYRHKTGTFESSVPGSGMLVYRINTSQDGQGNPQGPPDEVYIYRPGGTTTANGTPTNANFSSNTGRTSINNNTDPSSFLSDGSAGYLNINQVGTAGNTINFNVGFSTPSIPSLISPNDNATLVPLKPTFSWNHFTGATSYTLQVSTATDFTNNVIDSSGITSTSFTCNTNLNYNSTYYWRVNAYNGTVNSDWSNVFTFSTVPNITIDSIVGSLCVGNQFVIYYNAGITFGSNNTFFAQLSDTLGKFTLPVTIGQVSSQGSGSIVCRFPDTTAGGRNYRIRIVATDPQATGIEYDSNLTITPVFSPNINGAFVVCENSLLTYQTSNIRDISNKWVVEGGTIVGKPDSSIIRIQWGVADTGKISLYKKSVNGCQDSIKQLIMIYPIPKPQITGNVNTCEYATEIYSANSGQNIKNEWSITGGKIISILSDQLVKVGWGIHGNGTLTLTQTFTTTNCSNKKTINVTINSAPIADTISGNLTVCPGENSVYFSKVTPGTVNQWFVQNGTISKKNNTDSVIIRWGNTGSGLVKLIRASVTSGCSDTVSANIIINPKPQVTIIGDYRACSGMTQVYKTLQDTSVSSSWVVSGGNLISQNNLDSVIIVWGSAGNGNVTLIRTNKKSGCTDSASLDIVINQQPDKPTIAKHGDSLLSSSGIGNQWYLNSNIISGANNQVYVPTANGDYSVDVSVKNCTSDMSDLFHFIIGNVEFSNIMDKSVEVYPNPTDGKINVVFSNPILTKLQISITNLLGIGLYSKTLEDFGKNDLEIDLTGFPTGIYVMEINYGEKLISEKIIILLLQRCSII